MVVDLITKVVMKKKESPWLLRSGIMTPTMTMMNQSHKRIVLLPQIVFLLYLYQHSKIRKD